MTDIRRDWPDTNEPVEITVSNPRLRTYQLTCWRSPQGTVQYRMQQPGGGVSEALSTLQSKSRFPGKAVPGWQNEMIDAADAGLYRVQSAR